MGSESTDSRTSVIFETCHGRRCHASSMKALIITSALIVASPALAIEVCGSGPRITCVVDGDTVWIEGIKYRFEEIDTPEKDGLAKCPQEALQAAVATERLAEILTAYPFTIEPSGMDRYGRVLARFNIGKTTAGEMLIAEGLAKPWRGRTADWCQ
jgi:endonuclease YncB( thermonuclease family)